MRLETLIGEITDEMYRKILENHEADPEEARKTRGNRGPWRPLNTGISPTRRPRIMCSM